MTPTREEWRPVVGYEGLYEVSDQGRVRSLDRWVMIPGHKQPWLRPGRLMRMASDGQGRRVAILTRDGKHHRVRAYVLVLEAFVGPRPPGLIACHNDGNPSHDVLPNLRWDTYSGNTQDTLKHGRHPQRSKTHCPRNHPLQTPNLIPRRLALGHRICLACTRSKNNEWRAKNKGLEFDFQAVADEHYARIMKE